MFQVSDYRILGVPDCDIACHPLPTLSHAPAVTWAPRWEHPTGIDSARHTSPVTTQQIKGLACGALTRGCAIKHRIYNNNWSQLFRTIRHCRHLVRAPITRVFVRNPSHPTRNSRPVAVVSRIAHLDTAPRNPKFIQWQLSGILDPEKRNGICEKVLWSSARRSRISNPTNAKYRLLNKEKQVRVISAPTCNFTIHVGFPFC